MKITKPLHLLRSSDFQNNSVYTIEINYKKIEIQRNLTPSVKNWIVSKWDKNLMAYTGCGVFTNFNGAKALFNILLEKEKAKIFNQF